MHWLTELATNANYWLQQQLDTGSITALVFVFLSGVVTSLTPCVYPMIPVTVTFIGGASGGNRRRAALLSVVYVGGMAVIYASLGVAVALLSRLGRATIFGQFTRTPWIYGGVGLVIIVFGLAMMDLFTIPVPGFAGRVQSKGAGRGGFVGALLMGMAAGFVAAPCTAPVLTALLAYIATQEGNVLFTVTWGATLLLVFALGLGTLLMLVGMFSGLLTSLPRSGRWMKWIKLAMGGFMLLIGGWFLYQAVEIWRQT